MDSLREAAGGSCWKARLTFSGDERTEAYSMAHQFETDAKVADKEWDDLSFVLVDDIKPLPRIKLARERMLMTRLYLGLIRGINDDYGAGFAADSDSCTVRAIGIYVFLRTVMCS